MDRDAIPTLDRRTVLGGIASTGVASIAGCSLLESGDDGPSREVGDERARSLAEEFAPTIYFDRNEEWFPTDPRSYESDRDGATVVSGFDALEGYVHTDSEPPDPAVFYHAIEYEDSPLAVVQYWLYSAFDQFTTNFHWHDWELLQVFVDTDTGDPQLYVASSHSRSVPNNEFLDPERRPRILSELGSHSSGLSINEDEQHFQRFPLGADIADVTNSVIEGLEDVATVPFAYGLPRDEGLALPYVVPELDGAPVYEYDRLPSVEASDLVSGALTVRSFDDLQSPPGDLPHRETGLRFEHQGRESDDADVAYDLRPSADLEHIEAFTGPQLSFEFAIPDFAEDAIADHITTTGVPWNGQRYDDPASDISESRHRQALSDRYDAIGAPSEVDQVIARVTNAVSAEEAPDGEGLATIDPSLEAFALFESDPEAVPTFRGIVALQDVPSGEHTLTINGAGVAPHSESVTVPGGGETTIAGADGEIPLVARENATKLEVDADGTDADLTALAVEDDFAGRIYDAPLSGPDAVYVHRGGAFTTEVRDADDEVGAFRVNPDREARIRIDRPDTGTRPLARYVADVAEETRAQVSALDDGGGEPGGGSENAVTGLATALGAVAEAADRAAEHAAAGDRYAAKSRLDTVTTRLELVRTRLSEARDDLPPAVTRAVDRRLEQTSQRSEQARQAEKL